jgi:hypothetical protein
MKGGETMATPFNVSENIGFDGYSYFCRRCGKAGYSKPTQVRGHLAMCEGTLIRKGLPPTTGYNQLATGNHAGLRDRGANQLQPVRAASFGALDGGQLQPVEVVVGGGNYQLDNQFQQLAGRISALENEYRHSLMEMNRPKAESWVSKNIAWLVLGGILLLVLLSGGLGQVCQSPTGVSGSQPVRSGGSPFSSLGPKLVGTAVQRAMSKSIDRMFG